MSEILGGEEFHILGNQFQDVSRMYGTHYILAHGVRKSVLLSF